jgi:hypothetical protein
VDQLYLATLNDALENDFVAAVKDETPLSDEEFQVISKTKHTTDKSQMLLAHTICDDLVITCQDLNKEVVELYADGKIKERVTNWNAAVHGLTKENMQRDREDIRQNVDVMFRDDNAARVAAAQAIQRAFGLDFQNGKGFINTEQALTAYNTLMNDPVLPH